MDSVYACMRNALAFNLEYLQYLDINYISNTQKFLTPYTHMSI